MKSASSRSPLRKRLDSVWKSSNSRSRIGITWPGTFSTTSGFSSEPVRGAFEWIDAGSMGGPSGLGTITRRERLNHKLPKPDLDPAILGLGGLWEGERPRASHAKTGRDQRRTKAVRNDNASVTVTVMLWSTAGRRLPGLALALVLTSTRAGTVT